MSEVYVGATMSDGMVYHVAFQDRVRMPHDPGPPWVGPDAAGYYLRASSDENVAVELARYAPQWASRGVTLVSWRRLTDAEHALFATQRSYRDALADVGGKIQHDMDRARALHRQQLRTSRAAKFADLDALWMRATGQGNALVAVTIEEQRQALRDLPQNKAIDQAVTVTDLDAAWPSELAR